MLNGQRTSEVVAYVGNPTELNSLAISICYSTSLMCVVPATLLARISPYTVLLAAPLEELRCLRNNYSSRWGVVSWGDCAGQLRLLR